MENPHQLTVLTVLLPRARPAIPVELLRKGQGFSAGAVPAMIIGNVKCLANNN